jgi:ArsR family transcriptional regulator
MKKCMILTGKDQLSRAEISDLIQSELRSIGGEKGLREHLPPRQSLVKMAAIYNALSDPIRLTILYLLAVQPLCVCVIKSCTRIADSKLSYHLAILKKADLIEGEPQGNWISYRLTETGKKYVKEVI